MKYRWIIWKTRVDALAVKKVTQLPTDNLKSRDASASKKAILTWTITRAGLNEGSVLFICSTLKCMSGALTHALSPFPSTPLAPPTPCSFSISRWRLSEHSQADRWPLFVSPRDLWISDFLRQFYFRDPNQLSLSLTSLAWLDFWNKNFKRFCMISVSSFERWCSFVRGERVDTAGTRQFFSYISPPPSKKRL